MYRRVETSSSATLNTQTLTLKKGHSIIKASLIGGFFIAVQLLLSSCGREDHSDKKIFRYNEPSGIPTLDPAFARDKSTIWAVGQLYEGLFALNEHNEVVPALAQYYQVEHSTYSIFLREAYFHSGRRITASDVAYSFNRLVDPSVASPGAWVLERVKEVIAVNDTILHIELFEPFAAFPSLLTMPYCAVVDSVAANAGKLATEAGGSGPFKFHKWHFGEKLILHKNENYWRRDSKEIPLPYLDGVSVSFLPDQQSAFLEYLVGSFDLLPNIDPSFKDDLLTKDGALQERYMEDHILERSPFLNTEFLLFNAESELPYELRWAINAGIDRIQMMGLLRSGIGRPASGGIIPYGLPGHQEGIGVKYQPDSVRSLLASFQELPELTLTTVANYRDISEFIQGSLNQLGWSIAVDIVPSATLRSEKSAGTLDFFRASWIADYPDPENYLLLFASDMKAPIGPNYSLYSDEEYDIMYDALKFANDGASKIKLVQRMDVSLMSNSVCVPLYYDEVIRVHRKEMQGLETNALNALLLNKVVIP